MSSSHHPRHHPVKVMVRIRPPLIRERLQHHTFDCLRVASLREVQLRISNSSLLNLHSKDGVSDHPSSFYSFRFDQVLSEGTTQKQLFAALEVNNMIRHAFEGQSFTIIAYGHTGAGKTFSIDGDPNDEEEAGLLPRCIRALFAHMESHDSPGAFQVHCSASQVYCSEVHDLLVPKSPLSVRWTKRDGFFVENLSQLKVNDAKEGLDYVRRCVHNRVVGSRTLNMSSSRSHSLLSLMVDRSGKRVGSGARITFVDLAGSEKGEVGDVSFKESTSINNSLLVLRQVLDALAIRKKTKRVRTSRPNHIHHHHPHRRRNRSARPHVPFRDSVLTRLLKPSLIGRCRTIMIACLSSNDAHVEATLSTLMYASRTRRIETRVGFAEETSNTGTEPSPNERAEIIMLQEALDKSQFDMQQMADERDELEIENLRLRKEVELLRMKPNASDETEFEPEGEDPDDEGAVEDSISSFETQSQATKSGADKDAEPFIQAYDIQDRYRSDDDDKDEDNILSTSFVDKSMYSMPPLRLAAKLDLHPGHTSFEGPLSARYERTPNAALLDGMTSLTRFLREGGRRPRKASTPRQRKTTRQTGTRKSTRTTHSRRRRIGTRTLNDY